MNIDCWFYHDQFWEDDLRQIFINPHISFMNHFCFLQRKACFTELAILEMVICTKEHRGLAHQAAPNCLRSQLHYMVEAAFIKASSPG